VTQARAPFGIGADSAFPRASHPIPTLPHRGEGSATRRPLGAPGNLRANLFRNALWIGEGFVIANSHNGVALFRKPTVPFRIPRLSVVRIVPWTVDLNDKAGAMMREIGDESANRRLATDVQFQLSKGFPEPFFRQRHLTSQPLRPGCGSRRMSIMFEPTERTADDRTPPPQWGGGGRGVFTVW
jgi:hypothetical protein